MTKNLLFSPVFALLLISTSSLAASLSKSNFVAGKTTAIKVLDGSEDITTQYSLSSNSVSIVTMGGKPYVVGRVAGTQTITATHSDPAKTQTFNVEVSPGTPTKISLESGHAQRAIVGQAAVQPLKVKALDSFNNGVQGVSISFSAGAGGGKVDGQSNVQIQTDSTGSAQVSYTAGSILGQQFVVAEGPAFAISRGNKVSFLITAVSSASLAASKIKIVSPKQMDSGSQFSLSASLVDSSGETATSESKNITIGIYKNASCTVPAGTLAGTATKSTVSGSADFQGLSISKSGFYYIGASASGLPTACSGMIAVKEIASSIGSLVFSSIPSSAISGRAFYPAAKILLLSSKGHPFSPKSTVTIQAYSDAACSTPTTNPLAGKPEAISSFGTAVFSDLRFSDNATIYLKAKSGSVESACSSAIQIKSIVSISNAIPGAEPNTAKIKVGTSTINYNATFDPAFAGKEVAYDYTLYQTDGEILDGGQDLAIVQSNGSSKVPYDANFVDRVVKRYMSIKKPNGSFIYSKIEIDIEVLGTNSKFMVTVER